MPITDSAKKALRQSKRREKRNRKRKRQLKDLLKEIKSLISEGKIKEAKELYPTVQKRIDKSVKVNIIKENKGRRLKASLEKDIAKAQ